MNKFREAEGRRLQELVINSQASIAALQPPFSALPEQVTRVAQLAMRRGIMANLPDDDDVSPTPRAGVPQQQAQRSQLRSQRSRR